MNKQHGLLQTIKLTDEERVLAHPEQHQGQQRGLNHKRTPGEREDDFQLIARLYVRGKFLKEIAAELSAVRPYEVGETQIWKDIQTIKQRWTESAIVDFNERKMQELAHVDQLEKTYWDAWEGSRLPKESVQTERTSDKTATGQKTDAADGLVPTYTREKVRGKKEQRDGNVSYLQGVERCIMMRCKILGLDAPKTINVNWRDEAKKVGVDAASAFNELVGKYVQAIDDNGDNIEQLQSIDDDDQNDQSTDR